MRMVEVAAASLIILGLIISSAHPLEGDWQGVIISDNKEFQFAVHVRQALPAISATADGHRTLPSDIENKVLAEEAQYRSRSIDLKWNSRRTLFWIRLEWRLCSC
jgi:hypothetical protein